MTLEQAKRLAGHDYIHHLTKTNADGTPMRARVTSVKTWKRSPDRIELRYKRGLREYGVLNEGDLTDYGLGYGS